MKLTPLDIKRHEFKRIMRGYDPVEVDAFLDMVSDQLELMIREKNDLSDEVLKLKTQLRDYQSVETTLKDTLLSAQESMKESRANSSREAELVMQEAELKAEKIIENAKLRLAEMKNELVVIKAQKDSFSRRLRHLLESQLELIEVLELDDLGFRQYEAEPDAEAAVADRSTPKTEQEKIEFDSIEEELPEGPTSAGEDVRRIADDSPDEIGWGDRKAGESPDPEEASSSQPKISDRFVL